MKTTVRIAKSEAEREKVYRLRYKVYVDEMGVPVKADHERQMILDSLDATGHLLYAENGTGVVGTVRINFGADGPLEFEEEYRVRAFAPFYPHGISTTTKFIIDAAYRNSTVASRITNRLYEFALSHDIAFDFINISDYNLELYRKLGYRRYTANFRHPEWGEVIPMALALNDVRYLSEIDAPIAKLAHKDPAKQQEVDDFLNLGVVRLI